MSEILTYTAKDGHIELDHSFVEENVWYQISGLFGRDQSVISRYYYNILKINELVKNPVVAKFAPTAADSKLASSS